MIKEFREFISKGNMIDMAVGIIIGGAFSTIVSSLVNDMIMPPIGLVLGRLDFSELVVVLRPGDPAGPYATIQAAKDAGAVTLNYGLFINAIVNFLIIGLSVFALVRLFNAVRRELERKPPEAPPAPNTKECPYCLMSIHLKATRCPHCTSQLE